MSVVTSSGHSLSRIADELRAAGGDVTVTFWFERNSDSGAGEVGLDTHTGTGSERYMPGQVNAADRMVAVGGGFGTSGAFGPNPLGTGVWQYVKMTVTGAGAAVSMVVKELTDGGSAFASSVTLSGGSGLGDYAVDELWIGRDRGNANPAPWTFAFVKVWKGVVLSDADALAEREYYDIQTNLGNQWGNWWSDTDLAAFLNDRTGNGRTLTQNGTPTFSADAPTAILGASPSEPAAALSGTLADGGTESEIVAGAETIVITLTDDTWVAAGATFDAERQAIIDGLDAAASPPAGWNTQVRDTLAVTAVVRTSDTVVTITLPAVADYAINATETITVTVPASALVTSPDPLDAGDFDIFAGGDTLVDPLTGGIVS